MAFVLAAPLTGLPYKYHWYAKVFVPAAVAVKVAVPPAATVWFTGPIVMAGAVGKPAA